MENKDINLSKRIHFCLVSEQAAANFLPLVSFRPKKVVFFVSDTMVEKVKQLKQALAEAVPEMEIMEDIRVGDGWNGTLCYQRVYDALEEYENDKPVVNVTGGTKIMAFDAMQAANDASMPAFYLKMRPRDNPAVPTELFVFPTGDFQDKKTQMLSRFSLRIDHYLAAYGYKAKRESKKSSLPPQRTRLTEKLLSADSAMRDAVRRMNEVVKKADKRKDLTADPDEAKLNLPISDIKIRQAVDDLVYLCEDIGLLKVLADGKIRFVSKEACKYVGGGWLEEYVFNVVKNKMGLAAVCNLKVTRKTEREVDVAFMYGGKLFVIECKSGNLGIVTTENHNIIIRLRTLRSLGGIESRLVLVSYQMVNNEISDDAKDDHIEVIQGNQLNNLQVHIASLLEK